MKILNDFKCADGHVTEALREDSVTTLVCSHCGKDAIKVLAAPRSNLEGFTGAFPDAYDRWARVRADKLQQERKASA